MGKLPAADIDKILPAFYVIQKFIAALTTVSHSMTFITLQYFTTARYHQPSQPINHQEGETTCQPSATVFNTQSRLDVPV
jgi:hypothetical protein